MADSFNNKIILTGDPLHDARAVRSLCYDKAPQQLSLLTQERNVSLQLLDADTIKSCFITLVSTIETHSEEMGTVRESLDALCAGLGHQRSEEISELQRTVTTLQAALNNLAQNVQGFTEEDPTGEQGEDFTTPAPAAPDLADGRLWADEAIVSQNGQLLDEEMEKQTITYEDIDEEFKSTSASPPMLSPALPPASSAPASSYQTGNAGFERFDMEEGRRLWRKFIREVMRNKQKEHNAVGVLKSRAMKGQSIADRIRRLEEKMYVEFKRLREMLEANAARDEERAEALEAVGLRLDALQNHLSECLTRGELDRYLGVQNAKLEESRYRKQLADLEAKLESEHDKVHSIFKAIKKATDRLRIEACGVLDRTDDANESALCACVDHDVALRERRDALSVRAAELVFLRHALDKIDSTFMKVVAADDGRHELRQRTNNALANLSNIESIHANAQDELAESDTIMREIWRQLVKTRQRDMPELGVAIPSSDDIKARELLQSYMGRLKREVSLKASNEDVQKLSKQLEVLTTRVESAMDGADESRLVAVERGLTDLGRSVDRRIRMEVERLVDLALQNRLSSTTQENELAIKSYVASIEEQLRAHLKTHAQQIATLFAHKADKQTVELDFNAKLDKADADELATRGALQELAGTVKDISADLATCRSQKDRDLAALKRQLQDLVHDALPHREDFDNAAATTTCLTCAREVPETTREVEQITRHRQLLPRLGTDNEIHSPGALVNEAEPKADVYRAGFRMPLRAGLERPGTAPSGGERSGPNTLASSALQLGSSADISSIHDATLQLPASASQNQLQTMFYQRDTAQNTFAASFLEGYSPPPGNHLRWEGKVVRTTDRPLTSTGDRTRRAKMAALLKRGDGHMLVARSTGTSNKER